MKGNKQQTHIHRLLALLEILNSQSWDVVQPNFGNCPANSTLWLDVMSKHHKAT